MSSMGVACFVFLEFGAELTTGRLQVVVCVEKCSDLEREGPTLPNILWWAKLQCEIRVSLVGCFTRVGPPRPSLVHPFRGAV